MQGEKKTDSWRGGTIDEYVCVYAFTYTLVCALLEPSAAVAER